ncbi:hypothetical protein ZIOFF_066406 [Zingiber officinale]|uniref:Uncharacterized protein n=1 Tax=Zingiber officinale TaxID=94328 RepID=A0A8J5EYN0_ZINOF|nr:hypothetical protein ZIOFF_066406 [Zingiber officinale]
MPPPEEEGGAARRCCVWLVSCCFLMVLLAGGVLLALYIVLPESPDTASFPVAGVVLVAIPWLFWLVTCTYRCTKVCDVERPLVRAATVAPASGNKVTIAGGDDSFHYMLCSVTGSSVNQSIAALKGPVDLQVGHDSGNGADDRCDGDHERRQAQHLQAHPPRAPPPDPILCHVHLHREVNRQRPEAGRPSSPTTSLKNGSERQWQRYFPRDEAGVWPRSGRPLLHEGEQRLAEDLASTDEVDDDGSVGDVEEPKGVEAEVGEEVAGHLVAKGRVAHAAAQHVEEHCRDDGVLDFYEDEREEVGEGNVAEGLEVVPHLLGQRECEMTPMLIPVRQPLPLFQCKERLRIRWWTDDLGNALADGRVGEGQDGG